MVPTFPVQAPRSNIFRQGACYVEGEPTGAAPAAVEAPASTPVSAPAEPTTGIDTTAEATPTPSPADELDDNTLLEALSKRTHLGHENFKNVPAYNDTLNKSIGHRIEEDRAKFAQQQAMMEQLRGAQASMRATDPATLQQLKDEGRRYVFNGNKLEESERGLSLLQWEVQIDQAKRRPVADATARAYEAQAAATLRGMLSVHDDFKGADIDKIMAGAQTVPDLVAALAQEATKKERAAITAKVKAEVNKVLAAYHLTGDEAVLLPAGNDGKSNGFRSLDELNAAHASGKLESANDPYGNNAYRRHAAAFKR